MTPARILIVEDERVVARDIQRQLTELGYEVVGDTRRGGDAVRLAGELRPDLILMDIRLDGATDGVAAAEEIRARFQLPVVYLTAYADDDTLERARVTEPFGYILKPFEERELRTVIEMALYKHRAEQRLRASERRFAVTLGSIGDAVIATDDQARVAFINAVARTLTGWEAAEAAGRPLGEVFRIVNELTRQPVEDPALKVLRTGTVVGLANHTVLIARDGRELPIDDSGAPIIDDAGTVTGAVLVFHDVTERRRTEAELRASEERFRSVFETAHIGIAIADLDGHLLQVNPSYERMLGYTAEELRTMSLVDVTHPDDRPSSQQATRELVSGRAGSHYVEKRYLRKDGTSIWIHVTNSVVRDAGGEPLHLVAMAVDVTERKRAEKSLLLFRTLIDRTNDSIEVVDPKTGRYLDVNEQACVAHGYTREEYLALGVPDIDTAVTDWSALPASLVGLRDSGSRIVQSWHRRKDGSTFPVEVNVTYIAHDRDYLVAVVRDITERTRAQEELRQAEEKYHSIFDNALEGIFQSTPQGRFLTGNPALARMLGYASAEELIASIHDIASQLYVEPERRAEYARLLDEQGLVQGFECQVFRKDGSKAWVSLATRAVRDDRGKVLIYEGAMEEITERKRLEAQVRQSQKMDAIGQLAGGIAHDFNNLLTVINGYSALVFGKLHPDDPLREPVADVQTAGERAAALTRQLLAFSRNQILQPQVTDLNTLIVELARMLRRLIGEDVELTVRPDPNLGLVKIDPGQFEQVLMNLAVNARDAMPDGGALTIETKDTEIVVPPVQSQPDVRPGRYALLAVSDTGHGIDEATRSRIFEPFFTTKQVGKGTGLGLAVVHGIVRQSGGHIELSSEVGRGTTFKIYVPLVEGAVRRGAARAKSFEIPKGTETVLLVDDDTGVRSLASAVLRSCGYAVLEAPNGEEALRLARGYAGPIHLLVTDVVMPGINGSQLASRLTADRPAVRTLFVSGYTAQTRDFRGVLDAGEAYLPKPFTPSVLACKVREVLSSGAERSRER